MSYVVKVNLGDLGKDGGDVYARGVVQDIDDDQVATVWYPHPTDGSNVDKFARRDTADYGPEGGGKTWQYV